LDTIWWSDGQLDFFKLQNYLSKKVVFQFAFQIGRIYPKILKDFLEFSSKSPNSLNRFGNKGDFVQKNFTRIFHIQIINHRGSKGGLKHRQFHSWPYFVDVISD
jgi:hypothetical protein